MNRNFFWVSIILLIIVSVLIGCSNSGENSEAVSEEVNEKITLRFGHNAPENSPTGEAALRLAEIVEKETDGNFIIEVYPDNQLGDNRDLVEQTAIGVLDMSMSGLGVLGYLAPEYNVMQIPFIFESQEHVHNVVNGEIGEEISEILKNEKDILLLSQTWDRLPRQISANKEITTPEDLEGFMIRTGTIAATETFTLLGAKPTSVPLNEVYLSLQNNIIEGVELPADYMVNSSVAEVNSHLILTNHTYGTQFVAINNKVFNDLPDQYKEILIKAVEEAGQLNNQLTKEEEDTYINKLEEQGMEIVELTKEEYELFKNKVLEYAEQLESNWPGTEGFIEKIINAK